MSGGIRTYTPPHTKAYECYPFSNGGNFPSRRSDTRERRSRDADTASWLKKRCEAAADVGEVPHVKRFDVDNLAKVVLDGLNEIVFVDDTQII